MDNAYQLYTEALLSGIRGRALWNPNPGVNGETNVSNPAIAIGDVGYLHMGQFQRLFNVHLSGDDPTQGRDLPGGFEPLPREELRSVKYELAPQVFRSKEVRVVGAGVAASGCVFI